MPRSRDVSIAISALVGFSFWLFVVLPIYYGPPNDQGTDNCATEEYKNYGFWEKTRCEPVAYFTAWLVGFTGILGISTIGLWWETKNAASRQSDETKILQRAYISVEADGVHHWENELKCTPTIKIKNAGNLPARHLQWTIHATLDLSDRKPKSELKITNVLEGDNTLTPKTEMTQGGSPLPLGREGVRREANLYVYVWGLVRYNDGFVDGRETYFCHRYNCVNVKNVYPNISAPNAFSFDSAAQIAADKAREHRFGNEAT
jgi:hypothetical protein